MAFFTQEYSNDVLLFRDAASNKHHNPKFNNLHTTFNTQKLPALYSICFDGKQNQGHLHPHFQLSHI
jgi:hypothetical protein